MLLEVRCNQCKKRMKYEPRIFPLPLRMKKRCVYCGHSFQAHKAIVRKLS